jgi:HSP20 family protein
MPLSEWRKEVVMTLRKWNPLVADLAETRNRFNRLFGDNEVWNTAGVTNGGEWAPAVDIIENDHHLIVKAELPGIDAKDVTVTVDNNVLTLKGDRHTEKEVKKENYHRMERNLGGFYRAFVLPALVDGENIRAEFKNGLLTMTIPKREVDKTRVVEVNAA